MGLINTFLGQYLVRGFVLSTIGGVLAVLGLLFGSGVGIVTLELFGVGSEPIIETTESSIESGTLQFVGLMIAGVLFIFANSFLNQIPVVNSFAGFSNSISEASVKIAKEIVFIALPVTVLLVVCTITLCQWLFVDDAITRGLRDATVVSTMTTFPMVMFYQIGVQELTM